jgi:hypothetical protein
LKEKTELEAAIPTQQQNLTKAKNVKKCRTQQQALDNLEQK